MVDHYIKQIKNRKRTDTFLVKATAKCGYITMNKAIFIPNEFVGKRVRLKIEVAEE